MAKKRPLKPLKQVSAERAEKVRQAFAKMKEEGIKTEDAVHSLRVKYRLARSTVYNYLKG